MPELSSYRPRVFAVYGEHTYRASAEANSSSLIALTVDRDDDPVPQGLERDVRDASGRTYLAGVDQLAEWYSTRWTFGWRGGPFDVIGVVGDRIKGRYTGGQWGFADNFFLTQEREPDGTRWMYTMLVYQEAITDLTEHRVDLLATWKDEHKR